MCSAGPVRKPEVGTNYSCVKPILLIIEDKLCTLFPLFKIS